MNVLPNGWVDWVEPKDREAKGALQACREPHIRTQCAGCGEAIEEKEIMYSRNGNAWFCSLVCDKAYQAKIKAANERSDRASEQRRELLGRGD